MKKVNFLWIFLFLFILSGCNPTPREEVQISFDSLGGTEVSPLTIYSGENLPVLPEVTKLGHQFLGWWLDSTYTQKVKPENIFTSSVILYAKWEKITSTITFYTESDSVYEVLTGEYGQEIVVPDDPVKEGYDFVDWFLDTAHTVSFTQSHFLTEAINVYAKWKIKEYQVQIFHKDSLIYEAIKNHFDTLDLEDLPDMPGFEIDGLYFSNESLERYDYASSITSDLALSINYIPENLTYVTLEGAIEIKGYSGHFENLEVPTKIEGMYVKYIGAYSFYNSTLSSVHIPNTIERIEMNAFENAEISSITFELDSNLNFIAYKAFMNTKNLTSFQLPSSVEVIDSNAFRNSRIVEFIISQDSQLETINDLAFATTPIVSIFIPKSVSSMSGLAFIECMNLVNFAIDLDNQHYRFQDGSIFSIDNTILYRHLPAWSTSGTYIIPTGVEVIAWSAFSYTNYSQIHIPNTVRLIASHAFAYTDNLTHIYIPNSVESMGYYVIYGNSGQVRTIYIQNHTNKSLWALNYHENLTALIGSTERFHIVKTYA